MVHSGVLGAIFALSYAPFYDIYRDRAAAAGVDPAVDQQLAGLYMWIPAGIVLTVCGLALLIAWLAEAERRTKHAGSATVLALIVAGTSAAALASATGTYGRIGIHVSSIATAIMPEPGLSGAAGRDIVACLSVL
jgi:hypothetical protein